MVIAMYAGGLPFMQQMKTILKGFCALILALALISLSYVHFNKADLSQRVLKALRNQLATELKVASFEMDMLSSFPRIRFDMTEVSLEGKGGSNLLQAGELELSISLFSAFSDEIKFRKLLLKDGNVHVERLKDGSLSFDVIDSTGQSQASGPALHFNKIQLENVRVHYVDPSADQEYQLLFEEGSLTGSYGFQQLAFDIDGDVVYDKARIGKSVYLNGLKGTVSGDIILDLDDQLYTFEKLFLNIDDLQYEINGHVRENEGHQNVDLELKQYTGDLHTFLAMLPAGYRHDLPFSNTHGKFSAEGFIRGRINGTESPHIHFDLQVDDATVESKQGKGSLQNVDLNGAFDNGAFRRLSSARIDLPVIKGNAYGQKFDASLHIENFSDPILKCTFQGSLPASFVLDYTGMTDSLEKVSGAMHFTDVSIDPLRLNHIDFTDLKRMRGRCTLGNVMLQYQGEEYHIPDGTFVLADDTLEIADLRMALEQDKLLINGWIADLGDALEGNDPAYLHYDLSVKVGSLNIGDWFPGITENGPSHDHPQAKPVSFTEPALLRLPSGTLTLTADQFQYEKIVAKSLSFTGQSETHRLKFEMDGNVAEGRFHTNGELELSGGYQLHLQMIGEEVDVRTCFDQCENFGQQVLRSEHLRGKSDIKIIADMTWDQTGTFLKDQLHVYAGMSVRDGELIKLGMLEQFSDYVHTEDLRHIKFARVDNFIEVRNGNVYIPTMFIQSNAVNMVVNGVHRLDNHILYNLKLNAGQVVTSKMKKHNPVLTPLPARKEGTFNLFFTLTGTVDECAYDINKRSVESSFAQSAELREQIRARLKEVFGETVDLIEPPEWETIPEYDLEQEGEDTFLDIIDD